MAVGAGVPTSLPWWEAVNRLAGISREPLRATLQQSLNGLLTQPMPSDLKLVPHFRGNAAPVGLGQE